MLAPAGQPRAGLVLGPLLRWVGEREATIWVETDEACDVEVLGARARTFAIEGHHYGLVRVAGLAPGSRTPYEVRLDGRVAWPDGDRPAGRSAVSTLAPGRSLRLAFGSCRVAVPNAPPYTLAIEDHPAGRGHDALAALARRMDRGPATRWPDCLVLLGDQVYADEGSPRTRAFIRARRDPSRAPHLEAGDFEEYTRLYHESWSEPLIRWLLSTVPSAMIFDDHEVHDDWNISAEWIRDMRREPWWEARIVGAYMSYWVYQHIGNLSPRELDADPTWRAVRAGRGDAGPILRALGARSARSADGVRWSYSRDFGRTRLVMIDTRGGRHFPDGERHMVDQEEWAWITGEARGGVDHLLIGTSLPLFMAPGVHGLEAWSEAICAGAWGRPVAWLGERLRRALDLEHWPAFGRSFAALVDLIRAVGAGERGPPPASIVVLSGDVHNAYLAEVAFPAAARVRSRVSQAVCSPIRNPLAPRERRVVRFMASALAGRLGRGLAAAARVPRPPVRWRLREGPIFANQIGTIEIDGRRCDLRLERAAADRDDAALETSFERRLA